MKQIYLIMILAIALGTSQHIESDITKSFNVDRNSKINIIGEVDVVIENWNKNEVFIHATLDVDQKSVINFESSEKHDIVITEEEGNIYIRRIKPDAQFSIGEFSRDRSKIRINMPAWLDLDADIDDADFVAESLNGRLLIKGNDGSIIINSLNSSKAKIEFDDGSFKANSAAGVLILSYNDGAAQINLSECKKLVTHFDDGELKLNLSENSLLTFIEYNDGLVQLGLNRAEIFYIAAELSDGNIINRTSLIKRKIDDSAYDFGDKDAPNAIQIWFDDGSLTLADSFNY